MSKIVDKKQVFKILSFISDQDVKINTLRDFSATELADYYENKSEEFCSLINSFSINSFERINSLTGMFEKLFSSQGIDEVDFLKKFEASSAVPLLTCFPIMRIIKIAKNLSEKIDILQIKNKEKYNEFKTILESLKSFIKEKCPESQQAWSNLFLAFRSKDYTENANPYGHEGPYNPEEQAQEEIHNIEKEITGQLNQANVLCKKLYDVETIKFFVYYILSLQHVITDQTNALSEYYCCKDKATVIVELLCTEVDHC